MSIRRKKLLDTGLDRLIWEYPSLKDYLEARQIPVFPGLKLSELPEAVSDRWLRDKGLTAEKLLSEILFLIGDEEEEKQTADEREAERRRLLDGIRSITVVGGHDKDGARERCELTLHKGDTLCVAGATGSGKTRLLEDIEYLAAGDTPTGRRILINGAAPDDRTRILLENRLCAYLAQTMNFIMELSVRDFVLLHASCRSLKDGPALLDRVLSLSNRIAGERICPETVITELSGGQSRALMIADLVYISDAPVVLIDEPENAGIDKFEVINCLSGSGKIVLISTHEPVLSLSCRRRAVLKNGGISAVYERSEREEELLSEMRRTDERICRVREMLRSGAAL